MTPHDDDLGLAESSLAPLETSPTVFEVDRWTLRRGDELKKSKPLAKFTRIDELAWSDFHACLYERAPELAAFPEDELRRVFVEVMHFHDEIATLREMTRSSDWATEMAMPTVGQHYIAFLDAMEKLQQAAAEAGSSEGQPSPEEVAAGIVTKMAQEAIKGANEASATAASFGLDPGTGSKTDLSAIRRILDRTLKSKKLREIVDNAGRFTALARSRQRIRACQGVDDVVGVRLSDDLPRLLPTELAALGHPLLRVDAVRRLAEKQMMSREHQGVERVAKGPVMVWVDESGSMDGPRIATAKGLALAMAWVARKQRRWCSLVGFSSSEQLRSIVLPPGKWDEQALIGWCEGMFNGGTVVPFDKAEHLFAETDAPRGKTDILLVTDGETYSSADQLKRFLAWKEENQARLISLVIDCDGSTVAPYSDELHTMKSLSTAEDGVVAAVSV
jgi:uncharacterized protein with von Willebrand factor type A (vWA) domain